MMIRINDERLELLEGYNSPCDAKCVVVKKDEDVNSQPVSSVV